MKIKHITTRQWVAALKLLMGNADKFSARELNAAETKQLSEHLKGPFAKGMPQDAAVLVVDWLGWRIKDEEKKGEKQRSTRAQSRS